MAGKVKVPTRPVVVTANRLRDGRVVWLAGAALGTSWSEQVSEAALFEPADAEAGLQAGLQDEARQTVVGVYATEAEATPAGPVPLRYRERIRAYGPSIPLIIPPIATPEQQPADRIS